MENNLRCKCGVAMTEDEFNNHFQKCDDFRKCFRQFDTQFGELLKLYADPKENLLIIRVLLKQYISVLDNKIRHHFPNGLAYLNMPSTSNIAMKNTVSKKGSDMAIDRRINNGQDSLKTDSTYNIPAILEANKIAAVQQFDSTEVLGCQCCKDTNIQYLECDHVICMKCFYQLANTDLPNMKCKDCNSIISENYKKVILGTEEYERLDLQFALGCIGNVIDCPQCKEKIDFEKGKVDYNIKNDKNEKLSKEAAEHYAGYRCRCPKCKIDFCIECKSPPYHIGKTCEAFVKFVSAKKCKYDNSVIGPKNIGPADDVCSNPDCVLNFKTSCKKKLKCGHKCFGCFTEAKCPPCLEKTCAYYINLYDQDSDSYCNICFTEGLSAAPVVLLTCNHFIHHKCIETRLKKKWIGPKITFNHCLCPQCNKWVECPTVPDIQEMIAENTSLYESLCKMAIERLKFEGLNKDPKLTDPKSKWFKKDLEYALNRLSYYMCYECKKPYFAGLRECGEGPNVNNNNPNREYDPKDLICGAHANLAGVAGIADCKIHGKEFIEYKCKFCCKIASWFCWGTTHFCEDCHSRQCKGDYVSKYAKDKLPKCDKKTCEVKFDHPPNGEEFAMGCSVCRNNAANLKNF